MQAQLNQINADLEAVNSEISSLELALSQAKAKKTDLTQKQAQLQQALQQAVQQAEWEQQKQDMQQAQFAAVAAGPSGEESAAALQAKIAALQAQIAQAEKNAGGAPGAPEEEVVEYEEEIIEDVLEDDEEELQQPPKAQPAEEKKKGLFSRFGRKNKEAGTDAPSSPTRAPASPARRAPASLSKAAPTGSILVAHPAPALDPAPSGPAPTDPFATVEGSGVVINEDRYNKKHDWNRPGWAYAVEKQDDDRAVDSDSLNNPLLKQGQGSGYRRQVFAKDLNIDKKGTFVKPQARTPDPRKTWIVLRLNGDPIPGKLVMHLHGKDVHKVVDNFAEMKGRQVFRKGQAMIIEGEPPFHITTATARGLDSKAGVYGVVQEGHEIVNTILAGGPDAPVEVKQAHIFPIKKSKGGI